MTTPDLPMPGDTFGTQGAIVIASCWGNDDPEYGPLSCTLLTLAKSAPYYILHDVEVGQGGAWVVNASWDRDNIIPASELYSELIGGY